MKHPNPLAKAGRNDADVFKSLSAARKPLSAYDILDDVRRANGTARAPVQIYRALDRLMEAGEVHRVAALNAYVACSCKHQGSPPGFLVCTDCGTVSEFDAGNMAKVPRAGNNGFKIKSMNVEISGLCRACEERGAQK